MPDEQSDKYTPTGVNPLKSTDDIEAWRNFRWPTWGDIGSGFVAFTVLAAVVFIIWDWDSVKGVVFSPVALAMAAVDYLVELTLLEKLAIVCCFFLWRIAANSRRTNEQLRILRRHFNLD
jgi:hypothetical protein